MNRTAIIIIVAVVALSLGFALYIKTTTDNRIESLERDMERRKQEEAVREKADSQRRFREQSEQIQRDIEEIRRRDWERAVEQETMQRKWKEQWGLK